MSPLMLPMPVTAAAFGATDHKGYELVDGHVVERKGSLATGNTTANVLWAVGRYTESRDLGPWLSAVGICCFPDDPNRVRRPNASFVRRERLPKDMWKLTFLPFPPDLVVEVVPGSEQPVEVQRKVYEYLVAGVPVVWVIYPDKRTAVMHRADSSTEIDELGELQAEPVIPRFRCQLADVLPDWD